MSAGSTGNIEDLSLTDLSTSVYSVVACASRADFSSFNDLVAARGPEEASGSLLVSCVSSSYSFLN